MSSPLFTPSTSLEERLTSTLWSFTSTYWRGFVDFREPGRYWTHWGFGTWRSLGAQRITMRNGYDPFFFTLEFDAALERFECIDSNHHTRPVGVALYAYARDEVLTPIERRSVRVDDATEALPPLRVRGLLPR